MSDTTILLMIVLSALVGLTVGYCVGNNHDHD